MVCFMFDMRVAIVALLFFFIDAATAEIYTLSLHDALPICGGRQAWCLASHPRAGPIPGGRPRHRLPVRGCEARRSEEHTSELQSRFDLVCRLLLEKKK